MSDVTREDLTADGVVCVMRGVTDETLVPIAEAVIEGGVSVLEVTMNTDGAIDKIARLAEETSEDVLVGAGTVLDAESARTAILAGAQFVIAPNFDPDTIDVCNRYGVPVAPGINTPTEAVNAYEAGADLVKLFPASPLGPEYVSALQGPLPQIPVVPTGGISTDNAAAYFEAGAVAVGVGSALIDDEAIAAGDYDRITANAEELVAIADEYR
jgi:2-dehydro-3-deoxyphosphogluconate aldolase/(4S)-4-hydroxy-2-oxoglutarate aldolase